MTDADRDYWRGWLRGYAVGGLVVLIGVSAALLLLAWWWS